MKLSNTFSILGGYVPGNEGVVALEQDEVGDEPRSPEVEPALTNFKL